MNQHAFSVTSVAAAVTSWLTLANEIASLLAALVAIVAGTVSLIVAVRKLRRELRTAKDGGSG